MNARWMDRCVDYPFRETIGHAPASFVQVKVNPYIGADLMAHICTSDWAQVTVSPNAVAGIFRISESMPIDQTMIYGLTEVTSDSGRMEIAFGVFDANEIVAEGCIVSINKLKIYLQISKERMRDLKFLMIDCELNGGFPEFFMTNIDRNAPSFDLLLI